MKKNLRFYNNTSIKEVEKEESIISKLALIKNEDTKIYFAINSSHDLLFVSCNCKKAIVAVETIKESPDYYIQVP